MWRKPLFFLIFLVLDAVLDRVAGSFIVGVGMILADLLHLAAKAAYEDLTG